jgi:hypothetical protein
VSLEWTLFLPFPPAAARLALELFGFLAVRFNFQFEEAVIKRLYLLTAVEPFPDCGS